MKKNIDKEIQNLEQSIYSDTKKYIKLEEDHILKRTAYKFARNWKIINEEDIRQELYLWFFDNDTYYNKIEQWRKTENYLGNVVMDSKGVAYKYCKKEAKELYGGKIADDHFYTPERIEAALPYIWEITPVTEVVEHPNTGTPMNVKSKLNPETMGLAQAIVADITNVYNSLNKEEKRLIELYYYQGYTDKEVGFILGEIKEDAARQRRTRLIKKMHLKLSGRTLSWDSEKLGRQTTKDDY